MPNGITACDRLNDFRAMAILPQLIRLDQDMSKPLVQGTLRQHFAWMLA